MPRKVNYFEAEIQWPEATSYGLFDLEGNTIPTVIGAIETRKRRSFFSSSEDYIQGYSALSQFQWRLLVDAKEEIIIELRALRDSTESHAAYDTATYPVGLWPGISMANVGNLLYNSPDSAAELLTQIRDALAVQQTTDGDQLAALLQIAALLGGV